jgi:DNA-binding NarL/FixJ family response regulator
MFRKILIAEDFDVIGSGIKTALQEIGVEQIDYISYCDEAFCKLKNAYLNGEPYDLLISDLSFESDGTSQKLKAGEDLIKKVKTEFPNLKIIVFSVEDNPYRIQYLYNNLKVQGYVWKNRNGLADLKKAMYAAFNTNQFYISPDLNSAIHPKKALDITEYDLLLILNLSQGFTYKEISEMLEAKGVQPSSISVVEKRIKFMKEYFNAKNPINLVSIAKDFGLI